MGQELNKAETRFFESRGQDIDVSLRAGLGGAAGGGGEAGNAGGAGEQNDGGAAEGAGDQGGAGDEGRAGQDQGAGLGGAGSEGRPQGDTGTQGQEGGEQQGDKGQGGEGQQQGKEQLKGPADEHLRNLNAALVQERTEKKQLRDELRAYRDWQQKLVERFQQQGPGQGQPGQQGAPQAPDPNIDPLGYVNHVLEGVMKDTAGLQEWKQQQEQAARRDAVVTQLSDWSGSQEAEFVKTQPAYYDAYNFVADARRKELTALGYSPQQVKGILRENALEVIATAHARGQNPAQVVWDYAQARGFKPGTAQSKNGHGANGQGNGQGGGRQQDPDAQARAQRQIAEGQEAAGRMGTGGEGAGSGNMTAKDLAAITDPEEFEKAWTQVFGKARGSKGHFRH